MHSEGIIEKILRPLFYGMFVICYVFCFLQTTMLYPGWYPVMAKTLPWLMGAVYALALTSVISEFVIAGRGFRGKLTFVAKLGVILFCACLWMNRTDNFAFTALLLFAVSAHLGEEDVLLRMGFWLGFAIVAFLFILSLLGIVANNRGNSFGFLYRTDYSAHLLSLALIWCILKDGRLNWRGEFVLIALTVFMGLVVKGKTDFFCMFVLAALTITRNHIPALKRFITRKAAGVLRYSFVFATVLSFLFTLTYYPLSGIWNHVTGLDTVKTRMAYGSLGFRELSFTLFGNRIGEMGHGWRETGVAAYYFLDNSYVRLLLLYGVLGLAAFLGIMTFMQFRLHRCRRHYAVFALSVLALSSIIEFEPILLSYNILALLAFCKLSPKPARAPEVKFRWLLTVAALAGCAVLFLWCRTAWQVTSWRGHTPACDATLVVPSDPGSPLREARLDGAFSYMRQHPDAACIVASNADSVYLAKAGIDSVRVHVQPFSGIDEMLTDASAFIAAKDLPPRLTVCTFFCEQGFVTRRAAALHIPVNSVTMDLPKGRYLKHFTAMQWKQLWGKE